ncbi:hypothetical protein F8388_023109 [Cannabis sativa]|uniref:Uncharacterized protein n=1 Tax=Cannabis sativa TaxID=3483 RepID=A0A7J6FM50_CANSA|nr:hypothetical protein F8388_023109 [Cannabis sativa]
MVDENHHQANPSATVSTAGRLSSYTHDLHYLLVFRLESGKGGRNGLTIVTVLFVFFVFFDRSNSGCKYRGSVARVSFAIEVYDTGSSSFLPSCAPIGTCLQMLEATPINRKLAKL